MICMKTKRTIAVGLFASRDSGPGKDGERMDRFATARILDVAKAVPRRREWR